MKKLKRIVGIKTLRVIKPKGTALVKKKRKKKAFKVRMWEYKGLKCQGRLERKWCVQAFDDGLKPTKPKKIKTPFGFYTPDFELKDKYIEVKGLHTFNVLIGKKTYTKVGTLSTIQLKKIEWLNKNVKPVEINLFLREKEKEPEIPLTMNVKVVCWNYVAKFGKIISKKEL